MALVLADRVRESTTTSGTGTINLAGAATGFRTFVAGVGDGNTTYYTIVDGSAWEVGLGTVTDAATDTLSRTTILSSSNGGAAVSLSGGTADVFCDLPAYVAANPWDTISNASADKTTSNTTFRLVYQTAPTADSRIAWNFTESAAATNGTSTSGVPNQVLLKVNTLAASTQSPLSVYSRGSHVFSVSPSAAQILAGSANPVYSFAADSTTGLTGGSGTMTFRVGGTSLANLSSNQISFIQGNAGTPVIGNQTNNAGIWFPNTAVGFSISAAETAQIAAGLYQGSKASADAVSYAQNFRKSRGSVASPTVITTGDDLATLSGYGYVGATNTYLEAARITFDSTGTIADTTSGIGGIIRFSTTKAGTDTAVQTALEISGGSVPQLFAATGTATNPSYSFSSGTNYGMYLVAGVGVDLVAAGTTGVRARTDGIGVPAGSAGTPSIFNFSAGGSIFFPSGGGGVGFTAQGVGETVQFLSGVQQPSKGSADAVAYALNVRKSRGTVASPTVITTADALLTVSGYGYVGATNTYKEAARIEFDSAGTITDSTSGIGSVIKFKGTTQGTDTAVQDTLIITGGSTATLQIKGSGMVAANNTVATVLGSVGPTGANTTVQEWLAIKNSAGTTRYIPMF